MGLKIGSNSKIGIEPWFSLGTKMRTGIFETIVLQKKSLKPGVN